jgi:hypothetical protein
VYDYVDGKADWMAYGLPVEGADGPFLGGDLSAVPTCDVTGSVADARRVIGRAGDDVAVLIHAGLAVGEVDSHALEGQADDAQLLDVLKPVPSTVRPSVTVASVAKVGGGQRLVTTSDGRLLGLATVEPAGDHHDQHDNDHDHHDHHDHHHDDDESGTPELDVERYEQELTEVTNAVKERFGDREPPPDELQSFLRDRLVAEGRSAAEADRFVEGLRADDDD